MTKAELTNNVREMVNANPRTTVSKQDVEAVLEALGIAAAERLAAGEEVPLPGIGKLKVKVRAERQGRNPATGEPVTIPAKLKVSLVVAKALADAVNG
jgi:DNA-binding protein HU-beta